MSPTTGDGKLLLELVLASDEGNERIAMERVSEVVSGVLAADPLEKLKTAVAEATMNAIEHGNQNRQDLPVDVRVTLTDEAVRVHVVDHGAGADIPEQTAPDLQEKLDGRQSPRGWGLFLIKNMVDEMHVSSDDTHHTVELVMYLRGKT